MAKLILKPGRERSLKRFHPWVFDGAVERIDGRHKNGDTVDVLSADGEHLGKAGLSLESKIRARMWHFEQAPVDHALIKNRVAQAIEVRAGFDPQAGRRLIHGESDALPGLIVDQYAKVLVVQFGSVVIERWREAVLQALNTALDPVAIYERSDSDSRRLEGMDSINGLLQGTLPEASHVNEAGVLIPIDVIKGHKTGGYIDQRDNRIALQSMVAGKRVLNTFCYSGGFSLHALAGGATEVVSVDSSAPALEMAEQGMRLNPQLQSDRARWIAADVFDYLRQAVSEGEGFDVIILDPPKFAPTARHVEKASRAYKDINLFASRLLNPGGVLLSFSCSSGVGVELFQKIVAGAAVDAEVDLSIIKRLQAPADHPVRLAFPEAEYLKGLVLRRNS